MLAYKGASELQNVKPSLKPAFTFSRNTLKDKSVPLFLKSLKAGRFYWALWLGGTISRRDREPHFLPVRELGRCDSPKYYFKLPRTSFNARQALSPFKFSFLNSAVKRVKHCISLLKAAKYLLLGMSNIEGFCSLWIETKMQSYFPNLKRNIFLCFCISSYVLDDSRMWECKYSSCSEKSLHCLNFRVRASKSDRAKNMKVRFSRRYTSFILLCLCYFKMRVSF